MSRSRSAMTSSSWSRDAVREDLPARIAEVALPVELADVPRRLGPDAVDGADEVAVRDRVRRLLELPQVLRQPRDRRRRVEHDLRAVQPELARALGEVAVVADVDADLRVARLEDRIAEVAGLEVVLLPEAGRDLRDVVLPVLAEVGAVGVDDRGGVVVHAGATPPRRAARRCTIACFFADLLHQPRRRPVGDLLRRPRTSAASARRRSTGR